MKKKLLLIAIAASLLGCDIDGWKTTYENEGWTISYEKAGLISSGGIGSVPVREEFATHHAGLAKLEYLAVVNCATQEMGRRRIVETKTDGSQAFPDDAPLVPMATDSPRFSLLKIACN